MPSSCPRALVHAGADVHVLAFSWPSRLGDRARDSLMAATIAGAATTHPERVIIGLTGNLHSRSALRATSTTRYPVMTYVAKMMLPHRRVLGLNVSYDTGTAWVCLAGEASCGAHVINGHMIVPFHAIQLGALQQGYDGVYGVGVVTASAPAIPETR